MSMRFVVIGILLLAGAVRASADTAPNVVTDWETASDGESSGVPLRPRLLCHGSNRDGGDILRQGQTELDHRDLEERSASAGEDRADVHEAWFEEDL
jgi:hypothetical protein